MKAVKPKRVRAVIVHNSGAVDALDFAPTASWLIAPGPRYFVRLGEAYTTDRTAGVLVFAERKKPDLSPMVSAFEITL